MPTPRCSRRTRRLEVRRYRAGDFAAWRDAGLSRAPAADRWDVGPLAPAECTRAAFLRMLRRLRKHAATDRIHVFPAFRRSDGALVASVDFFVICRVQYQVANFGYQVHNRHRRRGYGIEACRAAFSIAFRELGLHRLEACIDPDNRASIALARRLGMRREGVKHSYLWEGGRWVDQLIFTAVAEDYGCPPRGPRRR